MLFTSLTGEAGAQRVEAVSLRDDRRVVILEGASPAAWSPTGHLLFTRDGVLFAIALDPIALKVSGTALPVIAKGPVAGTTNGGLSVASRRPATSPTLPQATEPPE